MRFHPILLCLLSLYTLPAFAQAPQLQYPAPFLPDAVHDPAVPTPEACLGFPVGQRAALPGEIERCLKAWAETSPRAKLVEYAKSHEDRPLYYMVITRAERMAQLDKIKDKLDRLADPSGLDAAQADALLEDLPGVAWMAYSIHGDETSGSDAALALIYHLTAGTGEPVQALLDSLIVIVDPMMNPDGRHRALTQVAEYRGETPNVDDQSLIHSGYWPWGRGNHYFFDLNRDWLFGVHPETRGRMRAVNQWHPLLFVDAHEMGPQDSYLFSPPRDPMNPHFPERDQAWNRLFAQDQARAFDRHDWRYYTGEWNEGWYPGYSDAWAAMGGAVGILYEQAGVSEDGVKRLNGDVLTYAESVHHQLVSSLANLRTLAGNVNAIQRDYLDLHRRAVNGDLPHAERVFAVLPTANRGRLQSFLELMELHGIQVYRLESEVTATGARDFLGQASSLTLPPGTLLIPNRQTQAYRVSAMLEFDTRIPEDTLAKEREKLLREGQTRLYDVTAWNLFMLYGLEAYTLRSPWPGGAEPITALPEPEPPVPVENPVAWSFDGRDDRSLIAAAELLQAGITVRLARKTTTLGEVPVFEGSPLVLVTDNEDSGGTLVQALERAAQASGLEPQALATGLGIGQLADLGGEYFPVLVEPRVALLARGGISPSSFGALWHLLDEYLGLRHSHLPANRLKDTDLRRYNVVVLPDRWFGELDKAAIKALSAWVHGGGTLIAVGGSAAQLAKLEPGLIQTRLLPDVFEELTPYRIALAREWQAAHGTPPAAQRVWNHQPPLQLSYPWSRADSAPADNGAGENTHTDPITLEPAQLKQRDQWQALFMPQGAIAASRVDGKSWLTLGVGDTLPVLVGDAPVLMAANDVTVPVRLGVYRETDAQDAQQPRPMNWAMVPAGCEPVLRLSGLLWPEAAHRLMNAAYLTRESVGKGQVILFAAPPYFRGATLGTARLMVNAILYGPALGAVPPIEP